MRDRPLTRQGYLMNEEAALALLRRFEPVVYFTRGEQFFPMDVEPYVRHCSLWVQRPGEEPVCLVPHGELTLAHLAHPYPAEFGAVHYLKLTDPLSVPQMAAYAIQSKRVSEPREKFYYGLGRLARVGYTSRFLDAIFSLSLLMRGRVPGDTAAAANLIYQHIQSQQEQYCYHGRVVRQDGWVVLQYWFFYLFNNWRSGFSGANDHEADWEMVTIYLAEKEDGEVFPEWVAMAMHDASGDDLRRRWDDPEVQKVGEHPVVFAGAGSHASYFTPGEYLAEIELPLLRPLLVLNDRLQKVWHEWLRQYRRDEPIGEGERQPSIFRIPFVDYTRGDGLRVGPGQPKQWAPPRLLTEATEWVTHFRGLWGMYTHDPLEGENAPAGPMFNRDGSVRRAWYNPVGWSGLDKEAPPDETLEVVRAQQTSIRARGRELCAEIAEKSRVLQGLGVEAAAMRQAPHLSKLYETHQARIQELAGEVDGLRARVAEDEALLDSLERYGVAWARGERPPLRAHIHRAHSPATEKALRASRLAELWAAASIGLMMIGMVTLAWLSPGHLLDGFMVIFALAVLIEAGFRGRLIQFVTSVTVLLAVVAALVLLYEFYWQAIVSLVFIIGCYVAWENLHELWRERRSHAARTSVPRAKAPMSGGE